METHSLPPVSPVASNFFRPFAFGATAYLWGINFLYLVTRGQFRSPDLWADVYTVFLVAYSAAPEVKRLMADGAYEDPDHWEEKIRKGGPIITLWVLLLAGAGFWRMVDATVPMPPELKSLTLQVIGVFFGTYTLRQYRRRDQRRRARANAVQAADKEVPETADSETVARVEAHLKTNGPSQPLAIAQVTGLSRRSVGRALDQLQDDGLVTRRARGPYDRAAVYEWAGAK